MHSGLQMVRGTSCCNPRFYKQFKCRSDRVNDVSAVKLDIFPVTGAKKAKPLITDYRCINTSCRAHKSCRLDVRNGSLPFMLLLRLAWPRVIRGSKVCISWVLLK